MVRKEIILFLIFESFFFSRMFFGKVVYFDCQSNEIRDVQKNPYKSWAKATNNVVNNQGLINCLPTQWADGVNTWLQYGKIQIMVCKNNLSNPGHCGETDNNIFYRIIVPEINNTDMCKCAEATIFHELIHIGARLPESPNNDHRIRGCEKLILEKLFPQCQNITGAECECQDEQGNPSPCK